MKIIQRPQSEQQVTRNQLQFLPQAALPLIVRSLQYTDYPTTVRSRTKPVNLDALEHPHYASLGAVEDFSDELLSWAYDRQCQCDPKNKPYYLDCLSGIAEGRSSEDLQTKAVMAESAGEYGQQAIENAYKFFGLDYKTKEGDDHIMGLFKSRIESAPRQKDEARKCLLIIGKARNSDKIEALANDRAMSYEEAMEFLQVSEEVTSDLIESAAVAMVCRLLKLRMLKVNQLTNLKIRPPKETYQKQHEQCELLQPSAVITIYNKQRRTWSPAPPVYLLIKHILDCRYTTACSPRRPFLPTFSNSRMTMGLAQGTIMPKLFVLSRLKGGAITYWQSLTIQMLL